MNEKSVLVPPDSTIVGPDGVFLRGVRLPESASVVLKIGAGQKLLTLRGVVCADCGELGAAVKFIGITAAESQALAHLFARHAGSSGPSAVPEDE